MGVYTKGALSKEIKPEWVIEVIKERLITDEDTIKVKKQDFKNFAIYYIDLNLKGKIHYLIMALSRDECDGTPFKQGDEHLSISLYANSEAIIIIKEILGVFSGYIEENDCDENDYYFVPQDSSINDDVFKKYQSIYIKSQKEILQMQLDKIIGEYSDLFDVEFEITENRKESPLL